MVWMWGLIMGLCLCCPGELQRSGAGCRGQDFLNFFSHSNTFLVSRGLCDGLLPSIGWWSCQRYGPHSHRPTRQCTVMLLLVFFLSTQIRSSWKTQVRACLRLFDSLRYLSTGAPTKPSQASRCRSLWAALSLTPSWPSSWSGQIVNFHTLTWTCRWSRCIQHTMCKIHFTNAFFKHFVCL